VIGDRSRAAGGDHPSPFPPSFSSPATFSREQQSGVGAALPYATRETRTPVIDGVIIDEVLRFA